MVVVRWFVMMFIFFLYCIEDVVGEEVGVVDGWFLFWDKYIVDVDCECIDL